MKNKWFVFVASLVLLIIVLNEMSKIVLAAELQLPSKVQYDDIGARIEEYVQEHEETTAGLALSIFDEETVIYSNYFGYADVERQIKVDSDTVFEWGSATKMLVWISVMQLWEQGKLDLDKDVRTYLPEGFLTNLAYDTPVTITMLMNHTAGFQECYVDVCTNDFAAVSPLGEALLKHEPAQIYEPGTVTAYSNWGCALAGYIVELVSGMDFYAYVKENIFEPLGMKHSALLPDLHDNPWVMEQRRLLQCYTTNKKLIPDCFYYIIWYPAGMCTSTLGDFACFARSLLQRDSALFSSPDTWEELFSATSYFGNTDIPRNCHGFWVLPMGVEVIGHGGNTMGCSSYLLLDLQNKIGTVVMTNQSNETIYNEDMMALIYGNYSNEAYKSADKQMPKGIYRSARTIRKGALKCLSLSFRIDEWEEDEYWEYVQNVSKETDSMICYAYGDYLRVPLLIFVVEIALLFLWLAALGFSAVVLIMKLLKYIYWKLYKKQSIRKQQFFKKWSATASILQLFGAALLTIVMGKVSTYAVGYTYIWMFSLFGLLALVMMAMVIVGFMKIRKNKCSRKSKVLHFMISIFMMVTVINICYWNLFMFWCI